MTDPVKTRVEQELVELSEMNTRIQAFVQEMSVTQSDIAKDALINAIALSLHSFYTGVERIFEVIARQIDYSEPSGSDWHRQLLEQMTLEIPNVRQAVISPSVRTDLDELRRFRHMVRSVYAYKLEALPVLNLVQQLPTIFTRIEQEIQHFLDS